MPVVVTRASNNYGPTSSRKADSADDLERSRRPAAAGLRRWHADSRLAVCGRSLPRNSGGARQRRAGEIYNIGGNRSLPNLDVIHKLLALAGKPESLIQYVKDRPGHDRRYALSSEKILRETGWRPKVDFETGLAAPSSGIAPTPMGRPRAQRRVSELLRAQLREPGVGRDKIIRATDEHG